MRLVLFLVPEGVGLDARQPREVAPSPQLGRRRPVFGPGGRLDGGDAQQCDRSTETAVGGAVVSESGDSRTDRISSTGKVIT